MQVNHMFLRAERTHSRGLV